MSGEAGSWGELGLFGKPNTRDITMTMARDFSREKKYPNTVTINLPLESWVSCEAKNTHDEISFSSSENRGKEPIFYEFLAITENNHVKVGEVVPELEEISLDLNLEFDPWVIKKRIEKSDVGHLARLLLAAGWVERHILPRWDGETIEKIEDGVGVAVWDCDTMSEHQLVFKKWPKGL